MNKSCLTNCHLRDSIWKQAIVISCKDWIFFSFKIKINHIERGITKTFIIYVTQKRIESRLSQEDVVCRRQNVNIILNKKNPISIYNRLIILDNSYILWIWKPNLRKYQYFTKLNEHLFIIKIKCLRQTIFHKYNEYFTCTSKRLLLALSKAYSNKIKITL